MDKIPKLDHQLAAEIASSAKREPPITEARRIYNRLMQQRRRTRWALEGRCTECGAERDSPSILCLVHRLQLQIRWQRSYERHGNPKRMAKARI